MNAHWKVRDSDMGGSLLFSRDSGLLARHVHALIILSITIINLKVL